MKEPETIQVNTLSDDPTSDDAFGSHQKIAEAIKNMVETEDGGKAIALEGTWGSGKSTVVKILSDLCGEERTAKQGTLVFTFDSWAHRGDPLRRSFFEKVVHSLVSAKWTTVDKWIEPIAELAGRLEKKTTISRPRIKLAGVVYALALALVPIGLVIISQQDKMPALYVCIAIYLALAPAILILVAFLLWVIALCLSEKRGDSLRDFIMPLYHKAETKDEIETVRTTDPTSIEFRKEFKKLLDGTLKGKERRLVIVVDNLDRVGRDVGLSIWSNLRTFFQFDDPVNSSWGKRVWLLVPYSQSGISQLWDNNGNGTSESFEAKTFQIKFHVPQPVLSDWDTYFMEQLDLAFYPNLPENEAHAVCSVFRQEVYPGVHSPTPRDIKAFINRIGTLIRYRGGEIRPEILAHYAALETQKSSESKPTSSEPKLLNTIIDDMDGKDYQAELIALHYGVSEPVARQLLLWKPLAKAIETGDPGPLRESQNTDGFRICCAEYVDKVVRHQTDFGESHIVANAAFVFAQLEIDEDRHWRKMWELLRDSALSIERWKTFDETTGDGLAKLIERFKGADLGGQFLAAISNSKSLFEDKDGNAIDEQLVQSALSGISTVIRCLADIEYSPIELELPGTPATFHHVMRLWIVDTDNADLAQYVVPEGDKDQVLATMTVVIGKGKYDETDYRLLRLWLSQDEEWKLETVIPNVEARLTTDQVSQPELRPLLLTLLLLHDLDPAKEALNRLAANAHILSHFGRIFGKLTAGDKALCVYLTLHHDPQGVIAAPIAPAAPGRDQYMKVLANPDADADVLEAVLKLYMENSDAAVLLTHADLEGGAGTFCKKLVHVMAGKEDVAQHVTPNQVIEYERILYDALKLDAYESLIRRFSEETDLIEKMLSQDFNAELTTLYLAVLKQAKGKILENVQMYLKQGLQAVDDQGWNDQAKPDSMTLLDLVVALAENGVRPELGSAYQSALSHLVSTHLESESGSVQLLKMWRWLLLGLKDNLRTIFLRDYRDQIIDAQSSEPVKGLLSLFTAEIIGCDLLDETPDTLVRKVLGRILTSKSTEELNWLHQTLLTCPNVSKKCRKETSPAFQEKISHLLNDENDVSEEFQAKLEEISKLLGAASS